MVSKMKGYGLLQPGNRQRALTDAEIKSVDFVVLRDRWFYLDKDFDRLYQQMDRCKKLKKPYTVSVMTGDDCAPTNIVERQPWNLDNLKRYSDLQVKLSTQLKERGYLDSVCGVWITGPTVPSQEMHLNGADKYSGYSKDKMVTAWKKAIETIHTCYPDRVAVLSISGQSSVVSYLDTVLNEAKRTFAKDKIVFQHNSLGTQTSTSATHHKKLLELHNQGYGVGAEMVQPGQTAGIKKFPQAKYIVLYSGDFSKSLPVRPK